MHWLQSLDAELFRFINLTLVNPVLDVGMPFASHSSLFAPLLVLALVLLVWKGRARGILCVLMLALILPLGDGKYTTTAPKKGYVYLCNVAQGGGDRRYNR